MAQLVRLFGIDAPEKGQACDDGQWHPGPLAKNALERFIAGRPVTCTQVGYDARNNRPVGQCFAGDDDLQAMMVSAGWAWSFGQYSQRSSVCWPTLVRSAGFATIPFPMTVSARSWRPPPGATGSNAQCWRRMVRGKRQQIGQFYRVAVVE
jgi:hypothetical protein